MFLIRPSGKEQGCFFSFFFLSFLSFVFLGPHLQHMEVPQARGRIGAAAAGQHHSHSNAGSLNHWARPGIEPTSSWVLVRFLNHWATAGTLRMFLSQMLPVLLAHTGPKLITAARAMGCTNWLETVWVHPVWRVGELNRVAYPATIDLGTQLHSLVCWQ